MTYRPGKNLAIISLPPSDANKTVSLGSGTKIEIRNLMQDQFSFEPSVATIVDCSSEQICRQHQTLTVLRPGDKILIDYRAGMRGHELDVLEDGTRILTADPSCIAGYHDGQNWRAYGQTVLVTSWDQDSDSKTESGLYYKEPERLQVYSTVLDCDPGYAHRLPGVSPGDLVLHHSDTDVEYRIDSKTTVLGIRHKDILARRLSDGLVPVRDCAVLEYDELKSDSLVLEGLKQNGVSIVLQSGCPDILPGDVVLHNRGELALRIAYPKCSSPLSGKPVVVISKEFIYSRV